MRPLADLRVAQGPSDRHAEAGERSERKPGAATPRHAVHKKDPPRDAVRKMEPPRSDVHKTEPPRDADIEINHATDGTSDALRRARYHRRALPKRIAILGSTGSIGCNALEVIEHLGADFRAVALSARSQTEKLLDQVRRHRPAAVAVAEDADESCCREIERLGAKIYRGPAGLVELVQRDDVDQVLA